MALESTNASPPLFRTEKNLAFPALTLAQVREIFRALRDDFGITDVQIAEAASYSMAMVVRYALGLTAQGGNVCVLAGDCLSGWTALATLRHLCAAGSGGTVFLAGYTLADASETASLELRPLVRQGISIMQLSSGSSHELTEALGRSHNVVCGLFDRDNPEKSIGSDLIELLNDSRAPIHCIDAPIGLDVDSGRALGDPLFASSTLSLGAPFMGLHSGKDLVGRHYVCDTSICEELYRTCGPNLTPLFSEQPVVKIIPVT